MSKKSGRAKTRPESDHAPSEIGEWFKDKGIDLAQLALAATALFSAATQVSVQPAPTDSTVQQAPSKKDDQPVIGFLNRYEAKGKSVPPYHAELNRRLEELGHILLTNDPLARAEQFTQFKKHWSAWMVTLTNKEQRQVTIDLSAFLARQDSI